MLRIRLQRRGRKKRPIHHIVVADNRKPRDGRIIEDIGRFDNVTPKNQLDLDRERALHWLKQGAQPSDTVRSIFKKQGIMYEMHLHRLDKSEEEIEEALAEWRERREGDEEDVTTRKERQQALLEAEQKEYEKQLQKKAEEAAKEKAKQEALASEEDEEEAKAEADEEVAEETETAEAEEKTQEAEADEQEETAEAQEEETAEEEVEEEATAEAEETSDEDEDADEVKAKEEETEEVEASDDEKDEETEEAEEESEVKTSTDMLAKEAIEHIENTPLNELEGFVTDEEDRVTVQRALDEKKENS